MKQREIKKEGVSPIIATMILISLVVTLSLVIWIFLQGFLAELYLKQQIPVQTICIDKVKISAYRGDLTTSPPDIVIINEGQVDLAGFQLEISKLGEKKRVFYNCSMGIGKTSFDSDPTTGCLSTFQTDFSDLVSGCEEVKIIPVIIGVGSRSGAIKEFPCETKTVTKKC